MIKNTIPTYPGMLQEHLIPLSQAGKYFPYPVGRKAIEQYFRQGIRGVYLETVLIGNRRMCSQEAIERFLLATNRPPENENTASGCSEA